MPRNTSHPSGSNTGPGIGVLSLYALRRAAEGASGRVVGVYPMRVDILTSIDLLQCETEGALTYEFPDLRMPRLLILTVRE